MNASATIWPLDFKPICRPSAGLLFGWGWVSSMGLNQIDLLDSLIATEDERAKVARIV